MTLGAGACAEPERARQQAQDGAALAATEAPAAPAGASSTVPFQFPQNQIVFEAYIGEAGPFNLILDTAVNPSVIDLATARELGLAIDEKRPLAAGGVGTDQVRVYPTQITELSVGDRTFPPFTAVAMDLEAIGSRLGRALHGALGYSFLRDRAIRVDYPQGEVSFYDGPTPTTLAPGGTEFPMVLVGTDVYLDSVFVNGRQLDVTLDTGASTALTVSSRAVERLGLGDLQATADPGLVRGARGTAQVLRAVADSLRLGRLTQRTPEIAFAPWVPVADGLLGNGFLMHFVLTVDYVGERVRLEPAAPRAD